MDSDVTSFLLSVLCAGFAYVARGLAGSWLTPLGIFSGTWALAFALFGTGLVDFITIRPETWMILAGATLSFSLGGCVPLIGLRGETARRQSGLQLSVPFAKALERVTMVSFPLAVVGLGAYLRLVNDAVGVDAYANELSAVRALQSTDEFKAGFSGYRFLYYFNVANAISAVLYLKCNPNAKPIARRAFWLIGAFSFAASLFSADRTLPFSVVVMCYLVLEYSRGVTSFSSGQELRRLLAVSAVLVTIFLGIGTLVGKTTENSGALRQVSHFPEELDFLATPYVYLTGNLPSFQEYMSTNAEWATGGLFCFLPVSKILRGVLDPKLQTPTEVAEFASIPFPFNTQTYLSVYWSDFGMFGVLIAPFFVGLATCALYRRTRLNPGGASVALAAIMGYAVSHSIFVNKFVSTPVWQHSIYLALIHLISRVIGGGDEAERQVSESETAVISQPARVLPSRS